MRSLVHAARRSPFALLVLSSLAAPACGGGTASAPPKSGGEATDAKAKDPHESIGELAAAQGGLSALGGNGNREASSGTESAMTGPLRAEEVDKKAPVKLDGVLKEWHARSSAHDTISGKADGLGLDVAIQYDDAKVYVAAEISDPKLARSSAHGANDDHVTLTIAFPAARGVLKGYEIGFWPGKPGESSGAVRYTDGPNKGQAVAGAKIVENDVKGGTVLEASLPWSTFAEADTMRVGLRGAFRYHDDGGAVIGNAGGSVDKPGELPALPTAAEQSVVDGLLAKRNLSGEKPKIDVYADIAGDAKKERISVFGRFFTICGPGYRGGHQFFWREVAGDIVSVEPRELTGEGKEELVVRKRVTQGGTIHEVLEVWGLGGGDEPSTLFAHQVAIAKSDGKHRITNAARISAKEIEVAVEAPIGWDASSFNEMLPNDVEPILLPWGTVRSKTFKLEGGKFTKASEVAQAGQATPAPSSGGTKPDASPRDVPTPTVAKGSPDFGKQVLEAYMKDANVPPGTKPRFDLEVHVDGDPKPERVLLIGRDIVVLGPSFKGGTGYARMSLTQFSDDKDVTEVTARDITGNGAADIVVRGVRHVSAGNGDRVDVQGLFVYQVTGGNLARVFAIETGREVGDKRVQGLVQFVPAKGGKGFDIDARPGVARGWTDKTYPWPQDKPNSGAIEPLLLPWGKIPNVRYTWNGTQFVGN